MIPHAVKINIISIDYFIGLICVSTINHDEK